MSGLIFDDSARSAGAVPHRRALQRPASLRSSTRSCKLQALALTAKCAEKEFASDVRLGIDRRRIGDGVHLRRHHDLRLRAQRVVEKRELALNGFELVDRIPARCARHIHEVDQHLRAVEMLQEPIAESLALVRPFNEAGHVGDDKAAIAAQRHDAKIRDQGGERVVGDLGPCGGNARDQRRFARVRKSDEADIGEQLEVQLQLPGFAGRAFFEPAGCTVGRADEARVAAAADASCATRIRCPASTRSPMRIGLSCGSAGFRK